MKEIKYLNKCVCGSEDQMSILPKLIHRVKKIPIKKKPSKSFLAIDEIILKFQQKCKGARITKAVWRNKRIKWKESAY